MKILSTLLFSSAICFAQIPSINIQFGGSLNQSCSFVNNDDVISSLETTINVLSQIQETEVACQNLLINAKAFIDSSLQASIEMQKTLYAARENRQILQAMIKAKTLTANGYQGEFDFELLTAEKEIALLEKKTHIEQVSLNQTMQLGTTVFNDLTNSPIACSHSFGQDILAPAIAVTGQIFSVVNPAIGAAGGLLSSIITYADRVLKPSYRSFKRLTQASNFHLTYKCAAKNIEKILCSLEDQELAMQAAQGDDEDNFLTEYKEKILSYDTKEEDFRKFFHLNRHRYRISKIIQDLENIYRSPETAQDIKTVVDYQTYFNGLALMPRLNPLKNKFYVEAMNSEGRSNPDLTSNWAEWNNNLVSWPIWYGTLRSSEAVVNLVFRNCQNIDLQKFPALKGVYNSGNNDCQAYGMVDQIQISQFIQAVIVPSLVFFQDEISRINEKIKTNANIHALYTNVNNQLYNSGNPDYKEYSLQELVTLYTQHASKNTNGSLRLYALDLKEIMSAIYELTISELVEDATFDDFVEATKKAYSKIATVSNNGQEGGILYRSIVESKISAYLDGVRENYIFHKDEKLAQRFVNFMFYAQDYQAMINMNESADSEGSSNIALMQNVKSAFIKTFSKVIGKVIKNEIDNYENNPSLKRELIHSCAIFYPMMDSDFKGRVNPIKRFCSSLIKKENGIKLFMNSQETHPYTDSSGSTFKDRCYYNNYEEAVMRHRINKAKRNRSRNRI